MSTLDTSTTCENLDSDPGFWKRLWLNNRGAILILCSEACASSMDAIARYLQQGENGMHAFQVIFARMSGTLILSFIYMWWMQIPNFPLGKASVRPLLILRALFGFGGMFCLYYSVHYLPLAEATVFRFLVPLLTAYACSKLLHQPFTRKELFVSILALLGIIIIAHPTGIFGSDTSSLTNLATHDSLLNGSIRINSGHIDVITSTQRLVAIFVATLGIIGASGAYTTIRLIGHRAHALHPVIYFAFICTVGSMFFLLLLPGIGFTAPRGIIEWILTLTLGVIGFALQFLMTKGLQLDSSSKATSMMYSQVIYAIILDWVIWRVLPDRWSLIGGAIVVGSTLWSALTKSKVQHGKPSAPLVVDDEERPLLRESRDRETETK